MAFISPAIWRPWLAIQIWCQLSMRTAAIRMPALKTSWPEPLKAFSRSAGEQSEDGGAEDAHADAACQPDGTAGNPLGCRHDDADDEAGFEDFAEDDDQACEHVFTVLPAR